MNQLIEDINILSELGCSGFAEATPQEYDLVRVAMKNAEKFTPSKQDEDSAE